MSYVIGGMAVFMAICGLAGVLMQLIGYHRELDNGAANSLFLSSGITALTAFLIWRFGRYLGKADRHLSRRDATLAVALIWLGAGIFGGLPFMLGAALAPADAFFEAISGFTTTGATILSDIEGTMSRPLLLWRSIIQWLGGMGIVVLFVAVFPNVGVGGKHMFKSEVPGPTAEGLQPRIAETSVTLWLLYTAFTVVEIILLALAGWLLPTPEGAATMDLYESICHALTTMSTGGFSTQNASVAAFKSPVIEMILSVFMLIAGVNFGLYYGALRARSFKAFLRSTEFRVYLTLVFGSILLLTITILPNHGDQILEALRYAIFMTATTITSTGYGTDDYMAFAPLPLMIVITLMFVGGMSGSTAGGIKISRVVLLAKSAWAQTRRSVRPSVIQIIRMSGRKVQQPVLTEVAVFFFVYMVFMLLGTLAVCTLEEIPLYTGFGAMLTSLSNMGPAPFYIGEDNFSAYSGLSKTIFSFMMILGRLEFFTLLALLLPDFWRR